MDDFGDFEEADAVDTAPADPEQVARRLHLLRRQIGWELHDWDRLDAFDQATRVGIVESLLAWGRRQGFFR